MVGEKRKKPKFVRQGYGRKKALDDNWRRPKGHQSKMRKKIAGKGALPSKGYRAPKSIRGTINGEKFYYVSNKKDLESVPEGAQIIISSTLGTKKMSEMLPSIKEKKIKILNKNKLKKVYAVKKKIQARKKEKTKNEKAPVEKVDSKSEASDNAQSNEGANNDKKNA